MIIRMISDIVGVTCIIGVFFMLGFLFRQPQIDKMRGKIETYEQIIKGYDDILNRYLKKGE